MNIRDQKFQTLFTGLILNTRSAYFQFRCHQITATFPIFQQGWSYVINPLTFDDEEKKGHNFLTFDTRVLEFKNILTDNE